MDGKITLKLVDDAGNLTSKEDLLISRKYLVYMNSQFEWVDAARATKFLEALELFC